MNDKHEHAHAHEHEHDGHVHSHGEHGHEHNHDHTHEHTHEHSHEHAHEHTHEHVHEHEHEAEADKHSRSVAFPKTVALMAYMLDHNDSHAAELEQIADKLDAEGLKDAASYLRGGVAEFRSGNKKLEQALKLVKES